MNAPLAYCVDFGTTNSLISVAYEGRDPEVIDLKAYGGGVASSKHYMPTVVEVDRYGQRLAGASAVTRYQPLAGLTHSCGPCERWNDECDGEPHPKVVLGKPVIEYTGCADSRLVHDLKRCLAEEIETLVYGPRFHVEDFVAIVLQRLRQSADSATASSCTRLVIGRPVVFPSLNSDPADPTACEATLTAAAEMAGFTEVRFFEEPAAALYDQRANSSIDEFEGVAVAVDFGGGTFDVAVSKDGFHPWHPDHTAGLTVGGADFDRVLFESKLLSYFGLLPKDPAWVNLSSRMRMLRASSDYSFLRGVSREGNAALQAVLRGGFAYELWDQVEKAKIRLSGKDEAPLRFVKADVAIDMVISRAEFEAATAHLLTQIEDKLRQTVEEVGVSCGDVRLVLRTGGSACMPAFVECVERVFPNARLADRDTFTAIVRGLAFRARELWDASFEWPSCGTALSRSVRVPRSSSNSRLAPLKKRMNRRAQRRSLARRNRNTMKVSAPRPC